MRVLQVTPTDIHPPRHGSEFRPHGIVSAFPSNGGEVTRFSQRRRGYPTLSWGGSEVTIGENYTEVRYSHPLCELTKAPSVLGYPSFVFLGSYLRRVEPRTLRELLDRSDVVLVEEFWQVPAVADLAGGTPIVYSTQAVGVEYLESVGGNPLGNWFYSRAEALEREAISRADMIICEHEADKRAIEGSYPSVGPVRAYENAVPASSVRDSSEPSERGRAVRREHGIDDKSVVGMFVGSHTDFNVDAARDLISVTERVVERGHDFVAVIVGSVGKAIDASDASVVTTGYVDDLEAYYDAADLGINSLTWGTTPTGSNIKMIEYLSRGLPVVATEYGASGYDLTPGRDVYVGTTDELDGLIADLCEDAEKRRELARNALRYVRESHTWETVSADLYRDLEEHLLDG